MTDPDRRKILRLAASAAAGATLGAPAARAAMDTGTVTGGKVAFAAWTAPTERPAPPPPVPLPPGERVGYAVLGLGRLALGEILPAFAQSTRARLVALVSGSPAKAKLVAHHHGVAPEAVSGYRRLREGGAPPDDRLSLPVRAEQPRRRGSGPRRALRQGAALRCRQHPEHGGADAVAFRDEGRH